MRVGFAGTPAFAARSLAAILEAGFTVPLVLTQPDRRQGRGMKIVPSPVKRLALTRSLPLLQPAPADLAAAGVAAAAGPLDVLVVAAYGGLLPKPVLAWPRCGCLNIHASLLPRWRGAAPIQRALLAGDVETGITIMQMDAGLDTGAMLRIDRVLIAPRDTAGSLHDKLAAAGAQAIVAVLRDLHGQGKLDATPQPGQGVTYAAKIDTAEALIDWGRDACAIERQIRAFNPAPGARTSLAGAGVKIWDAEAGAAWGKATAPGTIVAAAAEGLVVACGEDTLRVVELQAAGGRRMAAAAFAAGYRLAPGASFGAASKV